MAAGDVSQSEISKNSSGASLGNIIDGKAEAVLIRAKIKEEIDEIRKKNPNFVPGLAIIQVGMKKNFIEKIRYKQRNFFF